MPLALSIPPENIRFSVFKGYGKRPVAWDGLFSQESSVIDVLRGPKYASVNNAITVRDCLQILLLILSKFKRIIKLLFLLVSGGIDVNSFKFALY